MTDNLVELIWSLTPEDGASISEGAIVHLLRERLPHLSHEDFIAARDALVDDGILGLGNGRDGSIFRIVDDQDNVETDNADREEDGFELTTEEAGPRRQTTGPRKKGARKSVGPVQVMSYRHGETRVNNPEVGMVHAGTDPDGEKTTWAYDPHLDPVLNFDSARAGIETLIEGALPSRESEQAVEAVEAVVARTLRNLPRCRTWTRTAFLRRSGRRSWRIAPSTIATA